MIIYHFYPKTKNIGDHFVRTGIETMFKSLLSDAKFVSLNVNRRGDDENYGLSPQNVKLVNDNADIVVIGGSNLYEGKKRWGVDLDMDALKYLEVPLFLIGIGTGSRFLASAPRKPSHKVLEEIKALNEKALFSGVRDKITYEWLQKKGISKVSLIGDPATFIFNYPLQQHHGSYIIFVVPPSRFLRKKKIKDIFDLRRNYMFNAFRELVADFAQKGYKVIVACNDPRDVNIAYSLFKTASVPIVLPKNEGEYFSLLSSSWAVVTGRLHTAIVAFSLGIPFVLIDVDMRTTGFIRTYGLEDWSVRPSWIGFRKDLFAKAYSVLDDNNLTKWNQLITKRNEMCLRAFNLLKNSLAQI